jgi:hypothetical protein
MTGIQFLPGARIYLFAIMPRPALGFTQPYPMAISDSFPGDKVTQHEAND